MNIVENRRSDRQITWSARGAAEELAARTLQEGILRMTGVRLAARSSRQSIVGRPAIQIVAEDAPAGDLWCKDTYEIQVQGMDLVIHARPRRAAHYAVHALLESWGARFYGPDHIVYPKLDRLGVPAGPIRSTAAFSYRHVFYPTAQEPEWAIRWGLNVHHGRDRRWGENAIAHSWGHSFASLVPLERYFATHPEYFSLVDGQRRNRSQQLCCTNPAVADVACETMGRWIADNPDRRIFAVGMNDWNGWCECEACAAVDQQEGGPTGQLLTLVNRVAERFPDRIISTLAYAWAIDPPTAIHARDNVLIVLCHNEGCYTHALDDCDLNARFVQRLRGWKERSRRILIWDYYVNYHSYLMPTPNLARIGRDFRTYRDLGIEAMFCQGSAMRGGQFEGLRQFIQARLLWNPDQDVWQLADDWLGGVYGSGSGGAILEYLQMLESHVDKGRVHMPSFGSGQETQPAIFTPEILAGGKELWDRAEALASGPAAADVFAARAPEMCSRLFHAGLRYSVAGGRFAPTPSPDVALRDRFVAAAIAADATCLRENDGAPEDFARNYGRSYEAVVLESEILRITAIPELGGRLLSLVHKSTGVELLRGIDPVRHVNYGPYDAGYEFSIEPRWHGAGTAAEFAVEARDGHSVNLVATLDGGVWLHTRYSLDGRMLSVTHTVANRGSSPVAIAPCTHPEWLYEAFGDDAVLRLLRPDGSWMAVPLNPGHRDDRDLAWSGDQRAAGRWEMASAIHPFVLSQAFDAGAVDRCQLFLGRRRGSVNLELHYATMTLEPGQEARLATTWSVEPRIT